MDNEALLTHLHRALASITHPQFYADERGFQGELLVALRLSIPEQLLPEQAIVQQEYQKKMAVHGLTIRPDIIIHEPFDEARHATRREGNIAVIALKRRANGRKALQDFASLVSMLEVLEYPLAIFINVDSENTHSALVPEAGHGRIVCFAVAAHEGAVRILEERA